MELRTLIWVVAVLITAPLWVLVVLNWKRFRYDRQRHEEAILDRIRREANTRCEKLHRQERNLGDRLFSLLVKAAPDSTILRNPDGIGYEIAMPGAFSVFIDLLGSGWIAVYYPAHFPGAKRENFPADRFDEIAEKLCGIAQKHEVRS